MAHTPGPWTFEPESKTGDNVFGPNRERICDVFGNKADDPWRSNAQLIASAPTLLADLALARSDVDHWHQHCLQLQREKAEALRDAEQAKERLLQYDRSFEGHVYVKNEEYADLCQAKRDRDALQAENAGLRTDRQMLLNVLALSRDALADLCQNENDGGELLDKIDCLLQMDDD